MSKTLLTLSHDPAAALHELKAASMTSPVLVMKLSPICPISHAAEERYRQWVAGLADDINLSMAEIDVIAQKPLARGLTAELKIRHESPQALFLRDGELVWHDSHDALTGEAFSQLLG